MRAYLTICFSLISLASAFAQTSLFQDKAGETSIVSPDNAFFLNSGDASIGFQYSKSERNRLVPPRTDRRGFTLNYKPEIHYGGNIKVKASEGISQILKNGKFGAGVDVGAYFRRAFSQTSGATGEYASWYVAGKWTRTEFSLREDTLKTELTDRLFESLQLTAGIMGFGSATFLKGPNSIGGIVNSTYTYGIAFSTGKFSNIDDLNAIEHFTSVTTTAGGVNTTVLSEKKKGFEGSYHSAFGGKISADFFYFPQRIYMGRLGFGGNYRGTWMDDYSANNVSFGIVINAAKIPNQIVLGAFYQFKNLESNEGRSSDRMLNLVAGYKF
jgi:hypothetical protein